MKVQKDTNIDKVESGKATEGLEGYDVLNTAANIINEESQTDVKELSRADQRAARINSFLDIVDKPTDMPTRLMPLPSRRDQMQVNVEPKDYIQQATELKEVATKMRQKILRSLDTSAGGMTTGETLVLMERIQEIEKLLQNTDKEINLARSDMVLNRLYEEGLED